MVPILYLTGLLLHQFVKRTGSIAISGLIVILIAIYFCYSSYHEIHKRERFSFLAEDAYETVSSYKATKVYVYHPLLAIPLNYYSELREGERICKKVETENELREIASELERDELIISKTDTHTFRNLYLIDSIDDQLFIYRLENE